MWKKYEAPVSTEHSNSLRPALERQLSAPI